MNDLSIFNREDIFMYYDQDKETGEVANTDGLIILNFSIESDPKGETRLWGPNKERWTIGQVAEITNKHVRAELMLHMHRVQEEIDRQNEERFDIWEDQRDHGQYFVE